MCSRYKRSKASDAGMEMRDRGRHQTRAVRCSRAWPWREAKAVQSNNQQHVKGQIHMKMHSAAQEVAEALGLSVAADPRAGGALDGRCAGHDAGGIRAAWDTSSSCPAGRPSRAPLVNPRRC